MTLAGTIASAVCGYTAAPSEGAPDRFDECVGLPAAVDAGLAAIVA
jgi:hypothetical protein